MASKGFEINESGFRQMEREIQERMKKMNVTVPVQAEISSTSTPLRQQQNALLQAYYDLEAYGISTSALFADAVKCSGLDDDEAERARQLCEDEHLLERPTFIAEDFLTVQGRQYVERLMSRLHNTAPSVTNNFNAPIQNSQIITGGNAVQNLTVTGLDVEKLERFVELVAQFDTSVLSEVEQADFADDLEVIESQKMEAAKASSVRRAFRSIQTMAMTATGSASGRLLAEFVNNQIL